jgi:hypothetical protein
MRTRSATQRTMPPTRQKADGSRQFSQLEPRRIKRRDSDHVLIRGRPYSWGMLFLCAFTRLVAREPEANDLLAEAHAAIGHAGLTIIAIVFVLITFWKS